MPKELGTQGSLGKVPGKQPRSQGLSSLPPLSENSRFLPFLEGAKRRKRPGQCDRQERPWERGCMGSPKLTMTNDTRRQDWRNLSIRSLYLFA